MNNDKLRKIIVDTIESLQAVGADYHFDTIVDLHEALKLIETTEQQNDAIRNRLLKLTVSGRVQARSGR